MVGVITRQHSTIILFSELKAEKLSFVQNSGVFTLSVFMRVNNIDPSTASYPMGNMNTTTMKGFLLNYGNLGSPRQVGFFISRCVSGSSVYAKSTTNSINDTNWHHVAVVGDGTTVKMYVDGVQSGAAVTFTGTTGDSSFDLLLGGTRTSTGAFTNGFSGGLDGLLVFDRTLTDEEVAALATGKPTEDIDAEMLSQKYRYGYQGKYSELDQETGWSAFESRNYDPVIGRWTTLDPAREFWSRYLAMGNNPVLFIDPDGETIIIAGHTYVPGQEYTGKNMFIAGTVKSLNRLYQAEQAFGGSIIKALSAEGVELKILKTSSLEIRYRNADGTIGFNPLAAIDTYDGDPDDKNSKITGSQSAEIGLSHELGHAYNDLIQKNLVANTGKKPTQGDFANLEEQLAVETETIYLQQINRIFNLNNTIRFNDWGKGYKATSSEGTVRGDPRRPPKK